MPVSRLLLKILLLLAAAPAALTGAEGTAALHDAAAAGDAKTLSSLIAADPTGIDHVKGGMTALRQAAHFGHAESVRVLIEGGAKVDLPTKRGTTALHLAVEQRHVEAVQALLGGSANPGAASKKGGQTPLMLAAAAGFSEIVKLLLEEGGALVDQLNSNNATALFYASGTAISSSFVPT